MGFERFQVTLDSSLGSNLLTRSVVLEWLKRKQEQGVERGWKDGKPE
jgi:hypothetical protein